MARSVGRAATGESRPFGAGRQGRPQGTEGSTAGPHFPPLALAKALFRSRSGRILPLVSWVACEGPRTGPGASRAGNGLCCPKGVAVVIPPFPGQACPATLVAGDAVHDGHAHPERRDLAVEVPRHGALARQSLIAFGLDAASAAGAGPSSPRSPQHGSVRARGRCGLPASCSTEPAGPETGDLAAPAVPVDPAGAFPNARPGVPAKTGPASGVP